MTSWLFVQLFLFLIQSVLDLLLYHINQMAQTIEKNWNTLNMIKLRQWVAICIQMTQELSKKSTIQSFSFFNNFYNSFRNRHRYQALKCYLNVESNSQMSYNNASWFWKIEQAFNVFRIQLFLFIISENYFAVNKSAIKFHEFNKNKFQLRHKSVKENFIIYVLISNKNILHDFILWDSRDDLEYNKKNIMINIFSRTIKERQKSIIDVTVMKIHLLSTKEIIYILCERVTRNLHYFQFTCFIDNLFTDSHFVRIFLTLNVDICDII